MQNNVTELTQRLLRSLDNNYNVIDLPEVIEIISLLEKVAITKELLETTRLGKHVNELRRKTTNDSLSKRAKGLLKRWRSMVLPEPNGQIKTSPPLQCQIKPKQSPPKGVSPPIAVASPTVSISPKVSPGLTLQSQDVNLNQVKSKKRAAKEALDNVNAKRSRINGLTDLDLSDNSNLSFKDVMTAMPKSEPKRDVVIVNNSDSNSSHPERSEPAGGEQGNNACPKRRGRKPGSKNHKSLLDDAESSFTNKLAVSASRGSSKVKTTQELLASIQNKNSSVKSKEDLNEKAAKLTERVSIIDQKLNTNSRSNRNAQRGKFNLNQKNERGPFENSSTINDKTSHNHQSFSEDEIVIVDEIEPEIKPESEKVEEQVSDAPRSLSIEEALALLPPIDKSVLYDDDDGDESTPPTCTCKLVENKPPDFSVDDEDIGNDQPPFEFHEDTSCCAKQFLDNKYHTNNVTDEMVRRLHATYVPNVNGVYGMGEPRAEPRIVDGLYVNVVPDVYEKLDKCFDGENYKKYSVSEGVAASESVDGRTETMRFREWYECADRESYNGDICRILPYTIID